MIVVSIVYTVCCSGHSQTGCKPARWPSRSTKMDLQNASCELRNPPTFDWKSLVHEILGMGLLVSVLFAFV